MTPNERRLGWKLWTVGAALSAMTLAAMVSARTSAAERAAAPAQLNAEIVKTADIYRRAVVAHDAQAAAATYRDDAMELGPCGPPLKGRAAIEEHYRRMFQNLSITDFTFSHLDATVQGDLGYDVGTYSQTAGPSGTPGMTVTGKYLVVVKRAPGGGWKSAYVIFNFDGTPPPCGQ